MVLRRLMIAGKGLDERMEFRFSLTVDRLKKAAAPSILACSVPSVSTLMSRGMAPAEQMVVLFIEEAERVRRKVVAYSCRIESDDCRKLQSE